jgi:naphthoate synthase/2-ketocyclohexanecarboxyl-CoA hydrolase
MSSFEDIEYRVADGVAHVTIDRQKKLNAVRVQSLEELRSALAQANEDPDVGVVVLSGAGERAFCVGGELAAPIDPAEDRRFMRAALRFSEEMRAGGKPVVAKVRGYCIGGGNEINMLCDLSIAGESARFGHTGPKIGSVPLWYGVQVLLATVGEKRAREIVYLCRQYSAAQALDWGWINAVAPDDELDATVDQWCGEILSKGPGALRLAKLHINALSDSMHGSVYQGIESILMLHGTEEAAEGMSAFQEKRPPDFSRFRS